MEALKAAGLGFRFLLELCALAALGYWGFKTGRNDAERWLLGIGAPLLAAVLWGTFVAPRAPVDVAVLRIAFELVVFGAATAGLFAAGQPLLAVAFAVAAAADRALLFALDA